MISSILVSKVLGFRCNSITYYFLQIAFKFCTAAQQEGNEVDKTKADKEWAGYQSKSSIRHYGLLVDVFKGCLSLCAFSRANWPTSHIHAYRRSLQKDIFDSRM